MSRIISSTITNGVTLVNGDNPVTVLGSAYVSGPIGIGGPTGSSWTLTNQGTVAGVQYGVSLAQGGTVTNMTGASITGGTGVYIGDALSLAPASVSNAGSIGGPAGGIGFGIYLKTVGQVSNDATGLIEGGTGIKIYGSNAVVSNLGTITGTYGNPGGYGIYLRNSGTVTNGANGPSTATIQGYFGVDFKSSPITLPGTLANYGTILGTGADTAAVYVDGGGALTNGGSGATGALIQGGRWGAYFGLDATVTNFATIQAGDVDGDIGVSVDGGNATVSNLGGNALISGYVGVSVAYGTVINGGTIASTQPGGTALQFVSGDDRLIVDPGAVFQGYVIAGSSGPTVLELAGTATGTLGGLGTSFTNFGTIAVDAGANWTLTGVNTVSGPEPVYVGAGGYLDISGVLNGPAAFALDGSTLRMASAPDPATNFDLTTGTADVLQLDAVTGTEFTNAITGFGPGDEIILPGVTFAAGGIVTESGNTVTAQLADGDTFTFSDFTTQGTPTFLLGDHTLTDTACFMPGTHILTDAGEVQVEQLRAGDRVVTADGQVRRVCWIGHRRLDLRRHPEPDRTQPILIRANAVADGVPHRDLRVSPNHAVLLDDVLIPAQLLVNGASIQRETHWRTVTYYHVELETHDILLAEALPAESYLETGNRGMFDNADMPLVLHPDFAGGQRLRVAGSCRPFVDAADRVEPIWRRLAARAAAMGLTLPAETAVTNDPGPRVIVDGRTIEPISAHAGRYTFILASAHGPVRLVSHAARPRDLRPWVEDHRRLGIMVSRLTLRSGAEMRDIPLDDPRLSLGWWDVERDEATLWRWTDGNAIIPLSADGPTVLEVTVADCLDYPLVESSTDKASERSVAA